MQLMNWWLSLQLEVCNIGNSSKHNTMLCQIMTKFLFEDIKFLQPPVDILMPCPQSSQLPINKPSTACWGDSSGSTCSVSSVSNISFMDFQGIVKTVLCNQSIRPLTTRKRTIHPTNNTSVNSNSNLWGIPFSVFQVQLGQIQRRVQPYQKWIELQHQQHRKGE